MMVCWWVPSNAILYIVPCGKFDCHRLNHGSNQEQGSGVMINWYQNRLATTMEEIYLNLLQLLLKSTAGISLFNTSCLIAIDTPIHQQSAYNPNITYNKLNNKNTSTQ